MEISERETQALVQFRTRLDGIAQDSSDHFLIRWLRARDLDLKKAKEMLLKYLEWINNNKCMPILHHDWKIPEPVAEDLVYKFLGEDNDGRPVLWMPIGRYTVKKLLEEGFKDDCFRLAYQIMDEITQRAEEAMKTSGVNQFVGLLDMAELSIRKFSIDALRCTLRIFREIEMYFPEIIHAVYVINASYVFSYVYNVIKPIMSSRTMSKVRIFDSNETKWKPVLLENFPHDVIPREYGGKGRPVLY